MGVGSLMQTGEGGDRVIFGGLVDGDSLLESAFFLRVYRSAVKLNAKG